MILDHRMQKVPIESASTQIGQHLLDSAVVIANPLTWIDLIRIYLELITSQVAIIVAGARGLRYP